MKVFNSIVVGLAIVAASASSAYARDSFIVDINVGGYGYPAPAIGYSPGYVIGYSQAPTVVYYDQPVRVIRYAPIVSYGHQHYDNGHRNHDRGWGHGGREHHGWGRSGWERGHHGHHEGHR